MATRRDCCKKEKTTPSPRLQGMEENELLPKLSFEVLLIDVGSGTIYIKSFVVG